MKLQEYLKIVKEKPMSFAKKCEMTPMVLYKALSGKCRIDVKTALLIEKMTNGDVPLLELCDEEFKEKIKKIQSPFRKLKKGS